MRRSILIAIFVLALVYEVSAQSNPPLRIRESSTGVGRTNATALVFPNGSLSISGGVVTVTIAGTGTVTNTGTLTANAVIIGNGGADVTALAALGAAGTVLTSNGAGVPPSFQAGGGGANTALSNLGTTAINAPLIFAAGDAAHYVQFGGTRVFTNPSVGDGIVIGDGTTTAYQAISAPGSMDIYSNTGVTGGGTFFPFIHFGSSGEFTFNKSATTILSFSATALSPLAATGAAFDLGTVTEPFKNLYLLGSGTFALHSIELTGTPTGNRVVTFPDASITVARTDAGQTFTGVQGMTSPSITTSLVTASTTFTLLNTVATTVNAFGAATTLNVGGSASVLNFGGGATAAEFRFLEPSGSGTNYSAFKAVAQAANLTYSLPPSLLAGGALTDVAGDGVLTWVVPSGGSGLTVGTSTIASGTTTRVLFDNAGVLGEYVITGTGNVVMSASPTLTGTAGFAALTASGTIVQTSASATAFESGPNGSTNPVLRLVNNVASATTGLSITGNASGSGVTLTALGGTNESIILAPKGTGNLLLNTGLIQLFGATSSFPAIKRSGAAVHIRLADDSDFANAVAAKLYLSNNNGSAYQFVADPSVISGANVSNAGFYGWSSSSSAAAAPDTGLFRNAAGVAEVNNGTAGTFRDLISRNIKLGATTLRGTTEGTNTLSLFNGTAPVGTLANGASFYAAAGEMNVIDASGNVTLISPHDLNTNEWIFYSKNTVTGKVLRIDMERMMRAVDAKLGGGFIREYIEKVNQ